MSVWMGALGLGLVLGFRHACEPDHLTAVATLATERHGRRGALWLGALWGLGHTLALLALAALLSGLHGTLPRRLEALCELGVGAMLCVLGSRSIGLAIREGGVGSDRLHTHGNLEHEHRGSDRHVHLGTEILSLRPLVVGLIHGLAGSGALTAVAMAAMPTTVSRLAYVGLFGLGSLLGMAALTGLLGVPLRRLQRMPHARRLLQAAAGGLAVVLGGYWAVTSGAAAFP